MVVACFTLYTLCAPYALEWLERTEGTAANYTALAIDALTVEEYEIPIYYQRGVWGRSSLLPYRDYWVEYPPLAVLLFALPHFLTTLSALPASYATYRSIYAVLMGITLLAALYLVRALYRVLRNHDRMSHPSESEHSPRRPWRYLLLAPASLFFAFYRFDIVVSVVTMGSLVALFQRRIAVAWVLLAVAVMFKWYPVLLAPIYLSYSVAHRRFKEMYVGWALSALALVLVHLPIALYGGVSSLLQPYQFHVGRGANTESVLALIQSLTGEPLPALSAIFFPLQFLFAFLALFAAVKTPRQVVYWSLAAVAWFIFFAKFQSPQWILWLSPLMVAAIIRRRELLLFALLECATYYYYPLVFGAFHPDYPHLVPYLLIPQFIVMATVAVYYSRVVGYKLSSGFLVADRKRSTTFTKRMAGDA